MVDAGGIKKRLERDAREAGAEAERTGGVAEVAEDDGHVDALASGQNLLVARAVDHAEAHIVDADDIVERGVERDGADHEIPP